MNKCTIKGSENIVVQNSEHVEIDAEKPRHTYTLPAVVIIAAMWFMLGAAAFKWVLWRWV